MDEHWNCIIERAETGRWFVALDMNCDGIITITDVELWFQWAFFLPGDGAIWWVMSQWPEVAVFLETTPTALYGGWLSGALSLVGWVGGLGLTVFTCNAIMVAICDVMAAAGERGYSIIRSIKQRFRSK